MTISYSVRKRRAYNFFKSSNMNCTRTLVFSLLAIMTFANAQNLDSMEVETRDNPSAFLREKREIVNIPGLGIQNALLPSSGCFWSGTAPFCVPACGKNYQQVLTDKRGDGKICWTGFKKRCCPLPAGLIKING